MSYPVFPQPETAIGTLQTFKAISESNDQWYQKKMKTVRENPEDEPDYAVDEHGNLRRHIYDSSSVYREDPTSWN